MVFDDFRLYAIREKHSNRTFLIPAPSLVPSDIQGDKKNIENVCKTQNN